MPNEPTSRPAWLVSGVRVVDLATGCTGTVLAVGRPYDYTGDGSQTAFVVPPGGGIGWEAESAACARLGRRCLGERTA